MSTETEIVTLYHFKTAMQRYKENLKLRKICTINGYIFLKILVNEEKVGSSLGISVNYIKHLKMFEDYVELQKDKKKTTYIISYLADKYNVSESTVKRVIRKMLREVTL